MERNHKCVFSDRVAHSTKGRKAFGDQVPNNRLFTGHLRKMIFSGRSLRIPLSEKKKHTGADLYFRKVMSVAL